MRALFIQARFPGPFRYIAQALGSLPGARVLFLAERGRHDLRLPKVRRLAIPLAPLAENQPEGVRKRETAEQETASMLRHASATANVLLRLRSEGFVPDLVYASPSGGHSLYARDIFPEALHVAYANWFHAKDESFGFFHGDRPRSPVDFAPARIQNLLQYNALMESDLAVTSTCWQRDHYPASMAATIHVRPEGVDTTFFSPALQARAPEAEENVTFVWSEPSTFAGAPQFLASLPRLFSLRPHCQATILALTPGSRTAADAALESLPPPIRNRVRLLLPEAPEDVRARLRASDVHVYLTPPFTLTSLLPEAMSCGCLVVASDTAPVRELVSHEHEGLLTDFWSSEALASTVARALEGRDLPAMQAMRTAAREAMLQRHDLRTCTENHLHLLFDALRLHHEAGLKKICNTKY